MHGMSFHNAVLAAEVMQRKSCWNADAESTASGQATTTGPDWQQPMTIRSIRTANDQTLGRQPGSLKKRRRSLQDALQRSENCPHDQSQVQRFHFGMAAFPATTRAARSAQPTTGKQPARAEVNAEVNAGVSNSSKETITGSKRPQRAHPTCWKRMSRMRCSQCDPDTECLPAADCLPG